MYLSCIRLPTMYPFANLAGGLTESLNPFVCHFGSSTLAILREALL